MNLKELLKDKKITQLRLTEKLYKQFNYNKYQQQISSWVNGVSLPDSLAVYYISQVLSVSCDVVIKACLKSCGYNV